MTTLVPIDGSQSSLEAAKFAARQDKSSEILLVHVAPSARPQDLERGRVLLQRGRSACQSITAEVKVTLRLEVGDPREKLAEIVSSGRADQVVMGAHGINGLPHVDAVSQDAYSIRTALDRPVVMVTVQVSALPLHAPSQRAKRLPGAGVAVSVTTVSGANVAVQVMPQSMPAGLLVITPSPMPSLVTVRMGASGEKVAIT